MFTYSKADLQRDRQRRGPDWRVIVIGFLIAVAAASIGAGIGVMIIMVGDR